MHHSYLGTGCREVVVTELWVIELVLGVTVKSGELLQMHAVKIVVVFSGTNAAIRRMGHLEPVSGHQSTWQFDQILKALLTNGIATEIHWVPGHCAICRKY
jgi:hypothetical protein